MLFAQYLKGWNVKAYDVRLIAAKKEDSIKQMLHNIIRL